MDRRLSNALPCLLQPSGSESLMTMTMMEPTLNLFSVALARYALDGKAKLAAMLAIAPICSSTCNTSCPTVSLDGPCSVDIVLLTHAALQLHL